VLTIDESGRLVGGYAWVELRLFEIVGGWVPDVPEPEVKVRLAAQARHHAWHAELWFGHRPVVEGRDVDDLVAPPTAGAVAALDALASLGVPIPPDGEDAPDPPDADPAGEPGATLDRLAGLSRVVLPRLITAYGRHAEAGSAVADGPVLRTLRFVLADDVADWREGEALVQSLVRTPADAERAAAAVARLESLLAADGLTAPLP
jgi:hypothetical protein